MAQWTVLSLQLCSPTDFAAFLLPRCFLRIAASAVLLDSRAIFPAPCSLECPDAARRAAKVFGLQQKDRTHG